MDRLTRTATCAVALFSLTLAACGGGSSTATSAAAPANGASGGSATIQGVSTPSSVSVVTAKNAQ